MKLFFAAMLLVLPARVPAPSDDPITTVTHVCPAPDTNAARPVICVSPRPATSTGPTYRGAY